MGAEKMKIGTILIIILIAWLILKKPKPTEALAPLPQPDIGKPPPCGRFGDVDGDGVITLKDVELVGSHVIGEISLSPDQLYRADVNGDGRVDAIDGMMIKQYYEGVIETFPVCRIGKGR